MVDNKNHIECQVCGAEIPAGSPAVDCPSCGAPLAVAAQAEGGLSLVQQEELKETVRDMNESLMAAGAKNAESAFNLGCGLGLFLVIGSGILVYFLAGRSWILVVITLIMATLAVLWAVILAADLSKTGAIRRTFRLTVDPQINDLTLARRIHREEIERIAHLSLPATAPLRLQIPPLPETKEENENHAVEEP